MIKGFSVDFQREVQPGDAFEMLYERKIDLISGEEIGTKLHYAGLRLSGDQLGFYRFSKDDRVPAGLTRTETPPPEHRSGRQLPVRGFLFLRHAATSDQRI